MKEIDKLNFRPFTRFCMSIAAVPSSYIAGMTLEEQVLWFCSYLEKEVIPAVNNNAEAVEELQGLFIELKSYVDNYFDNLDVQEEINNKLDDMAESGELEDIISTYLQTKALFGFDTVSDMKNAENLSDGTYAKTLGFYNKNDGGGAIYKIRTITNDDVVDDATIIEILTDDTLVAELTNASNLNTMQFGIAKNTTDNMSTRLQIAINYVDSKSIDKNLTIANGEYAMETGVIIPQNVNIDGSYSKIYSKINGGYMFGLNTNQAMTTWVVGWPTNQHVIKNLQVHPFDDTITTGGVFVIGGSVKFENIKIHKMYQSIKQINNYIDAKSFINVYVQEGLGDYDCRLTLGDGLNIDQCTEIRFDIEGAAGLTIKNCINLGLNLKAIKGGIITGLHNELPMALNFEGCMLTMEDCYIKRKKSLSSAITVNYKYHSASSIILKNIQITYFNNEGFEDSTTYNDIVAGWGSCITCENVYRASIYFAGGYDEYTSQIYVNDNLVNPLFRHYKIENKKVIPLENNKTTYETNYTFDTLTQSVRENYGQYNTSDGTFYITNVQYLDTTRLIRAYQQYRNIRNITIANDNTSLNYGMTISQTLPNSIIRFYRGPASGTYTHICDFPVFNPTNLMIDNKTTIGNVAKWREIGSETFNSGLIAFNYETDGTNVTIKASAIPTVGTWTKGDIIINSNPSASGVYGWICITGGTPGTWKAISTIAP